MERETAYTVSPDNPYLMMGYMHTEIPGSMEKMVNQFRHIIAMRDAEANVLCDRVFRAEMAYNVLLSKKTKDISE